MPQATKAGLQISEKELHRCMNLSHSTMVRWARNEAPAIFQFDADLFHAVTNIEDVKLNKAQPIVEQVGPYTYRFVASHFVNGAIPFSLLSSVF